MHETAVLICHFSLEGCCYWIRKSVDISLSVCVLNKSMYSIWKFRMGSSHSINFTQPLPYGLFSSLLFWVFWITAHSFTSSFHYCLSKLFSTVIVYFSSRRLLFHMMQFVTLWTYGLLTILSLFTNAKRCRLLWPVQTSTRSACKGWKESSIMLIHHKHQRGEHARC